MTSWEHLRPHGGPPAFPGPWSNKPTFSRILCPRTSLCGLSDSLKPELWLLCLIQGVNVGTRGTPAVFRRWLGSGVPHRRGVQSCSWVNNPVGGSPEHNILCKSVSFRGGAPPVLTTPPPPVVPAQPLWHLEGICQCGPVGAGRLSRSEHACVRGLQGDLRVNTERQATPLQQGP